MSTQLDLTKFEGHSSAPWYAGRSHISDDIAISKINRFGVTIATIPMEVFDDPESCHNAALIAAAPTLLAELKAEREKSAGLETEVKRLREGLQDASRVLHYYQTAWNTDFEGDPSEPHLCRRFKVPSDSLMEDEGSRAQEGLIRIDAALSPVTEDTK